MPQQSLPSGRNASLLADKAADALKGRKESVIRDTLELHSMALTPFDHRLRHREYRHLAVRLKHARIESLDGTVRIGLFQL